MRYHHEEAGSVTGKVTKALLTGLVFAAISTAVLSAQAAADLLWRGQKLPFTSEDEILEYLQTAKVVKQKRLKQGINQPFKIRLSKDGVELDAVFRDIDLRLSRLEIKGTLRTDFRDSALFEVAAYQLSRMLGLNLVPPTVRRKVYSQKGSVQLWIDGAMTEGDREDRKLMPPNQLSWARLRQIRWIFDSLVHNDDRNLGNSLIDQDWNLWLIDHTRCFYPFDRLLMEEQLTHIDGGLWEALKATSQEDVRQRMNGLLEKREVDALLARWTRLVEHYQAQIDERGEERVLFSLADDGS